VAGCLLVIVSCVSACVAFACGFVLDDVVGVVVAPSLGRLECTCNKVAWSLEWAWSLGASLGLVGWLRVCPVIDFSIVLRDGTSRIPVQHSRT
jgi:hypothetical protein